MKNKFLLSAVCVAALMINEGAQSASTDLNVQVISDNGAAVQKPREHAELVAYLLAQLDRAKSNRKNRHGEVNIINTVPLNANDVARTVWSGRINEIAKSAPAIKHSLTHIADGCSNLSRAFKEALVNLKSTAAKRKWVFIVAPMIDLGRACANQQVSLPQQVPAGINISELIADAGVERITILGAEGDQRLVWQEALNNAGGSFRVGDGTLELTVANTDQSLSWIKNADFRKAIK